MKWCLAVCGLCVLVGCWPPPEENPQDLPDQTEALIFDFPADQQTVKQASSALGRNVELTVDAGTFAKGMNGDIRLIEDGQEQQDIAEQWGAVVDVTMIGEPVELTFDTVQSAGMDRSMVVTFELTQAELDQAANSDKAIYAYVQQSGARLVGAQHDPDVASWTMALGALEPTEDGALFRVNIFSTAETSLVVPVIGESFTVYFDEPTAGTRNAAQLDGPGNILERPWAILCVSENEEDCSMREDSGSALLAAGQLFPVAAQFYYDQEYTEANIASYPLVNVLQIAKKDNPRLNLPDINPGGFYNVAILRDPLSCGDYPKAIGCYDPSNRMISVARKAIFPEARKEGDPIAHEIAHAIEAAMAPDLYDAEFHKRNLWVMEGLAEALAYWYAAYGDPASMLRSLDKDSRDWAFSLQETSLLIPYEAREFFALQQGGNMDYLYDLLQIFKNLDLTQHPYEFMDEAFTELYKLYDSPKWEFFKQAEAAQSEPFATGLNTESDLGIAYLNAVVSENPYNGYEYCGQVWDLNIAAGEESKIDSYSGWINPLSMNCRRVRSKDHYDRHGDACIKLTLESAISSNTELVLGETDLRTVMVVSGVPSYNERGLPQSISYDGEPLWVDGPEFSVQVIDTNIAEALAQAPAESKRDWTLYAEIDPTCAGLNECFPTRITCLPESCTLWMTVPGSDCWGRVARCDETGCYERELGDWVPNSLSECSDLKANLQSFLNPPTDADGEVLPYWDIPYDSPGFCNGANFCKRIILCAK